MMPPKKPPVIQINNPPEKLTPEDEALRRRFAAEMQDLCASKAYIELAILPQDAWLMLSFLQLALRHPSVGRFPTVARVREIARRLQALVAPHGTALEDVAERGWKETVA